MSCTWVWACVYVHSWYSIRVLACLCFTQCPWRSSRTQFISESSDIANRFPEIRTLLSPHPSFYTLLICSSRLTIDLNVKGVRVLAWGLDLNFTSLGSVAWWINCWVTTFPDIAMAVGHHNNVKRVNRWKEMRKDQAKMRWEKRIHRYVTFIYSSTLKVP